MVICLQVWFRRISLALGKWTSQCEFSEVTLARDDWADSRDHQVIHQWSSVWPIWGGNQIWRTNSKWEDWGGGVQWFDPGQWGWPGPGVVVKYPILLFLKIIINTNTLLHAWGFEKIFFCKQDLQASDIPLNTNIVQPIHQSLHPAQNFWVSAIHSLSSIVSVSEVWSWCSRCGLCRSRR